MIVGYFTADVLPWYQDVTLKKSYIQLFMDINILLTE